MTPQELCSLAAKINAAVPGLVPPMKCHGYESSVDVFNGDHGYRPSQLKNAAAMMLGWVVTAKTAMMLRAGSDESTLHFLVATENKLTAFLLNELPEAT